MCKWAHGIYKAMYSYQVTIAINVNTWNTQLSGNRHDIIWKRIIKQQIRIDKRVKQFSIQVITQNRVRKN